MRLAKKSRAKKIKKLLALSTSPNENEAEAALKKANELMAAYKITHTDLADIVCKTCYGIIKEKSGQGQAVKHL